MSDRRLTELGARDLAQVVRSGGASAEEVARAHLDRIGALDPHLGAYQAVDRELVLRDARAVDADATRRGGPLSGVPVAVKDNIDVAGYPTRCGSAATPEAPVADDHELVRRLRAAGAFVAGKTRMPELAIWPFTEPVAFGISRNPWSPDRTAGGSTGGGAVAVAARMATLALGADGGGSLRIPAACCGVCAFKPAPGLVPLPGSITAHWFGLSASGPIARSMDDAALMLDVLAGGPPRPPLREPDAPLRIAISTRPVLAGGRVDAEVVAVTEQARQHLTAVGHAVTKADPPYPADMALRFGGRFLPGIATDAEALDPARLEPRTRAMARAGRLIRGVLRRVGRRTPVQREPFTAHMVAWFADHDLLLMPVLASPPVRNGRWRGGWVSTMLGVSGWILTAQWNLAGFPAAAVPVALSREGLPIGVQIVAPPGREALILSAAHQLATLSSFPSWREEPVKPGGPSGSALRADAGATA